MTVLQHFVILQNLQIPQSLYVYLDHPRREISKFHVPFRRFSYFLYFRRKLQFSIKTILVFRIPLLTSSNLEE